jgi:hypothetical protein
MPSRTVLRWITLGALGIVVLCLPAAAWAHEGEFKKFNDCPSTESGVRKCVYSVTNGGTIVLGSKKTPIVNPVTLQGGIFAPNEETNIAKFAGAVGGETLSKTPQPVPGGLAGIVPPESAPLLVKLAIAFFFENGLTGVNATLELAKPASEIEISTFNLLIEEGLALRLPVKVHLENPFLGSSCYVGSNSNPIIWNLTTGPTSPPSPYESIHGQAGFPELKEHNELAEVTENELVENAWEAPKATGCGEPLSLLVDPVINAAIGLPSTPGKNTAILKNTILTASVGAVNSH